MESRPTPLNEMMDTACIAPTVVGEEWLQLDREWDALAQRAHASPYLRPGWFHAWRRAFAMGAGLEVATVRRAGRLTAVLPLLHRGGHVRSATNWHTPQFGILSETADDAHEVARRLFASAPRRVTIASLDPADGALEACCAAARAAGYRFAVRPYQRSPYLSLAYGKDTGKDARPYPSKGLAAELCRADRRLSREGTVTIEVAHGRERLDELLAEAFAVEASSWKGEQHTAIQSQPPTRAFYTGVGHWAAGRGMLRLFFLRLDGRALAMLFALEDDGVCYLLKGGYDPLYRRYSPGKLLMRAAVAQALSSRLRRIELHGGDEPYKLRWADGVCERQVFDAFAPSAAGLLDWATVCHVRPRASRILSVAGLRPRSAPSAGTLLQLPAARFARAVGKSELGVLHTLASHPLLTLDALARLADALPPQAIERHSAVQPLLVPGGAPDIGGVLPSETVRGIATNGCWMVLWNLEQSPEYRALLDAILDQAAPLIPRSEGSMRRRECFLFLSAPGAITPVHFDPEHNFLLQIRGLKRITIGRFPDREWALRELDRYHDGGHRNLESVPPESRTFAMTPGQGVYIYPWAPHWVHNGPEASISLSITFRTGLSERHEQVHRWNARMRRYGLHPRPAGDSPLVYSAKSGLLHAAQWLRRGGRRQRGARDFT